MQPAQGRCHSAEQWRARRAPAALLVAGHELLQHALEAAAVPHAAPLRAVPVLLHEDHAPAAPLARRRVRVALVHLPLAPAAIAHVPAVLRAIASIEVKLEP